MPHTTTSPQEIDLARKITNNLDKVQAKRPLNPREQADYDKARSVLDRAAPNQPGTRNTRNTSNPKDLVLAGDGPISQTHDAAADVPPAAPAQGASAVGTTIQSPVTTNPNAPTASAGGPTSPAGGPNPPPSPSSANEASGTSTSPSATPPGRSTPTSNSDGTSPPGPTGSDGIVGGNPPASAKQPPDLDATRKARQTINNLSAPGRQNTFQEALQLHEAENTMASAIKANLEKKKSVTGTLSEHETSALAKANATLARHAPRDRGPLPAIPDARRTIQDLSAEANGTLTAPQRRELDRFRETLAASPYGTELPKGPPPGFDPHATNPAHREWHPPHGDKPIHPTNDKFKPEALAISDNEIKATPMTDMDQR